MDLIVVRPCRPGRPRSRNLGVALVAGIGIAVAVTIYLVSRRNPVGSRKVDEPDRPATPASPTPVSQE